VEDEQQQLQKRYGLKDSEGGVWSSSSGSFYFELRPSLRMTAGTGNNNSKSNGKRNSKSNGKATAIATTAAGQAEF